MKDLIDRQELIDNLNRFAPEHYSALINDLITKQKAVDVQVELQHMIECAAEEGAKKAIKKLKDAGRITYNFSNSFKKTESLLYLYPKLSEDHPERKRVDQALEKIKNDDYCDVIASRYFDGLTITEISEIYDCKYQNISKKRNKLIRILAAELFPEDVLKELLER